MDVFITIECSKYSTIENKDLSYGWTQSSIYEARRYLRANNVLLKDTSAEWTYAESRRKLCVAGSEMSRERLLINWRPLSSKAVSML